MSDSSASDCASSEFVSFLLSSLSLSNLSVRTFVGPIAPETTSARLSAADYDFAYKGRRGGGRSV